ncbi:MAG: glutamate synthase subunit beta [Acidimicrobiales bacterium]
MGDPKAFLLKARQGPTRRPVAVRLRDWREVYEPSPPELASEQASRCMDCGIPFCHEGCPLGNLIPEWNDLVYRGRLDEAATRLEGTNNFPEFTGRLCPAPCEGSCVLGINSDPVSIKHVELEIAEWSASRMRPHVVERRTGKRVAVVGSGPAGLAAAQQLTRAGHDVSVFERAERPGGLLRYGIPEFKMEKSVLDRRLNQMHAEGTVFLTGVSVGVPPGGRPVEAGVNGAQAPGCSYIAAQSLFGRFDAVVLAGGATAPRDLSVPGRDLAGVHLAMEYLKPSNQVCEGSLVATPITATGKHVVIIGGGDTGADCLGTAHRQGAASVCQLEIMPEPPASRAGDNPWPTWPVIMRTSSAHEEGGERVFGVATVELVAGELVGGELVGGELVGGAGGGELGGGAGGGELVGGAGGVGGGQGVGRRAAGGGKRVRAVRLQEVVQQFVGGRIQFVPVPGTEREIEADLVLLAMGFVGPERTGVVAELALDLDRRGNVAVGADFQTSAAGVFSCGDMTRGQSLVVWAIAEGRSAAAAVDRYLMGTTSLPQPIVSGQLALG